jgi:hypothetical protein
MEFSVSNLLRELGENPPRAATYGNRSKKLVRAHRIELWTPTMSR